MIHNLAENNALVGQFVAELRSSEIQTDRMRFRRNLERIGEICAYEIAKHLPTTTIEVSTPLGVAECLVLVQQPVLATILRAGLPLHQGLLNYFDRADNAFISAYRKHHKSGEFTIQLEYLSCPDLDDRTIIRIEIVRSPTAPYRECAAGPNRRRIAIRHRHRFRCGNIAVERTKRREREI